MGLKKSRFTQCRMPDDMFDEIEKIASEEISSFSEITRKLIKLGTKLYKIKGKIITPEALDEMKKEVDSKIKNETFLNSLLALNSEQKSSIVTYLQMQEEKSF